MKSTVVFFEVATGVPRVDDDVATPPDGPSRDLSGHHRLPFPSFVSRKTGYLRPDDHYFRTLSQLHFLNENGGVLANRYSYPRMHCFSLTLLIYYYARRYGIRVDDTHQIHTAYESTTAQQLGLRWPGHWLCLALWRVGVALAVHSLPTPRRL